MTAKKIILVIVSSAFFIGTVFGQVLPKKLFVVKGSVKKNNPYCGGVAPSAEMVAESNKARPYIGKVFYIKRGVTNSTKVKVVLKIVTDSLGQFAIHLEPGQYIFVQAEQVKALDLNKIIIGNFLHADASCLKQWWQTPYYSFEIKDKNIENLKFEFNKRCFVESDIPCLQYFGPMPP